MKKNKNRPGYKRTKAGWLPDDWFTSTPASFATICTGGRDTKDKVDDGEYPFFVRSQTPERIDTYSYDGIAVLTAGDGVGTGKVFHLIDGKFDYHQRVYKISDFDTSMFPRYFFECFRLNFIRQVRRYSAKGSVDSVRMEMIADMPIPLPSLPEQEAIAEVLECWDKAIRGYERKIEKKRNIKKGLMQRLLSGKQRLPGFDGEWKEVRLGEICVVRRGASPRPIKDPKWFSDEGRGWVRIADVTKCARYLRATSQYLSQEGAKNSVTVDPGELIMSICATIGVPRIVDIPVCIHDGFVVLRDLARCDQLFLFYMLSEGTEKLAGKGQPGTQKNLNADIVRRIRVNLPPLTEQQAITVVLSSADTEIYALERKLVTLREQKRFLLDNMVTGTIRLPQFANTDAADVTTGDTE